MRYLGRKLAFYLVAAWAAITLNFVLPQLIPGNPVLILIAKMQDSGPVPPGEEQILTKLLGLGGGNVFQRYWQYLDNLVHLRLGLSVTDFPTPVTEELRSTMLWTLVLVGTATVLSFVIGISLGALAGWKRGTKLDALIPSTTFLTALPYFWLALILLYLFADTVWNVFPGYGGYDTNSELDVGFNWPFLASAVQHAVLPALTVVLSSIGGWLLGMRNMMVSTLSEDYVVAAEAKGLRGHRVAIGYAARNAVLPSVSGFAVSLGLVVSGSVVMEQVFSYPGIGAKLFAAVQNDDYPLMQGIFLVITLAVLGANLIVDLLYGLIDPRTRVGR
ncbi:MAG TPA: ABC transporter permease [Pseudonocardiaceae bacterium]|jgi:peptide/nickel transport system permease protein|nr:ABC transporter permease [Pseudonocardiaceae bacterium]